MAEPKRIPPVTPADANLEIPPAAKPKLSLTKSAPQAEQKQKIAEEDGSNGAPSG